MFTALLLPLLLAGTPPGAAAQAASGDDPAIQIWISNDRRFVRGEQAKVQVRTREDGYLLVLHADPDGHLRVLFPIDPKDDNFVRGGRKYEIRGRGGRESFTADDRTGRGTVYAAVAHDPFSFDQFVLSDHWDYRTLAPQRLSADPEPELNDLVRRMVVDGSFDYDVLTYDVIERVVYADSYGSSYSTPYYGDAYFGGYDCGYSYFGCGRSYYGSPFSVSVGLFFGRPYHRRYYYDPYYAAYDPFYDPFFYDPYYYSPVRYGYYPYYNHGYYGGYYNRPYYGGYYNRTYTPYRFRPADGLNVGYRDRRYDLRRSVNTVYMPPIVRDRQPVNASPGRRVADQQAVGATVSPAPERRGTSRAGDAGTARRGTDRTPGGAAERSPGRRVEKSRLEQPNIEARRAREPEERRSLIPDSRDARGRDNLPTEVRSSSRSGATARRAAEGPQEARGSDARPEQVEARPARPSRQDDGAARGDGGARNDDGYRGPTRAEPRAEPRSEPRAEPRAAPPPRSEPRSEAQPSGRGGDRGSYSPPAQSGGDSRGGGGDRGGGSGGGGGRRR
jgi:hypothetical protein